MMTQFTPSDTIVAQFPTTSKRIAVPGVVLSIGTTLADADTKSCGCMFLNVTCRPVQEDAAGNVTVQVAPDLLLITHASVSAKTKFTVLVTGAAVVETPHDGGVLGPFDVNTWPTVPERSFAKVVVVFAYKMSPTEYDPIPVPPLIAGVMPSPPPVTVYRL